MASSVYRAASFGSFVLAPLVAAASPAGYRASVYMATGLCVLSLLSSLPMLGKLQHLDAYLRPPVVVGEEGGEEVLLMEGGKEGGGEMRRTKEGEEGEEGGEEEEMVEKGGVMERKWEGWMNYFKGLGDPGFLLLLVRRGEGGREGGGVGMPCPIYSHSSLSSLFPSLPRWLSAPCTWRSRACKRSLSIFCRKTTTSPRGVLRSLPPFLT